MLDEDVRLGLVAGLTERGFDVVSVHQVGPTGVEDGLVLDRAIKLGRVLITHNTDDFKAIHAAFLRHGRSHSGIICLPQRGTLRRRLVRASLMLDWVGTQPRLSQLFVWGHLQQLLERGFRLPDFSEDEVREALGWI